jgi:hypothetical protein
VPFIKVWGNIRKYKILRVIKKVIPKYIKKIPVKFLIFLLIKNCARRIEMLSVYLAAIQRDVA